MIQRFEVYLVNLDPTVGRPCVVISPNEINHHLQTVIVAPMTTKGLPCPTRVACTFQGKRGQVVLDQIRAVDRVRLVKRLGKLSANQAVQVLAVLGAMFAE